MKRNNRIETTVRDAKKARKFGTLVGRKSDAVLSEAYKTLLKAGKANGKSVDELIKEINARHKKK